jgi:excisionase family DNA binding protein
MFDEAGFAEVRIPKFSHSGSAVMNPRESDHEILTVKDMCDLRQVHQSTVYKLIKAGKIPTFRIGADWRFRRDQIMSWIAEQTIRAHQ